ncbi:MAG TPA: 16S rRNA (uracil(1498)-N(3))-methyltransferase [Bacteroidales bacterium]|nr:16S rRNA (uracil(1498)-N(3))-methyltransferase [Bacteroidales bacterium]
MQIFYTSDVNETTATFRKDESGHCIRVLRMRKGDPINFTDGRGSLYQGVISNDSHIMMEASFSTVFREYGRRKYRLHAAISPLKNNDRYEWFIEKAVELGIDEITPLICSRTEKTRIKRDRLESLIMSAMKQSVKTYLPVLNEPLLIKDFLAKDLPGVKIIAHCNEFPERRPISEVVHRGEDVVIMIGPEGDFRVEEVMMAVQDGFVSVHLGESRLRTETAGIAACCSVYLTNI